MGTGTHAGWWRTGLLGVSLALAMLAAGCGSGTGSTSQTTTPPAPTATTGTAAPTATSAPSGATADVSIGGSIGTFKFNPGTLTIKVGTTVTWTNKTQLPHTATSDSSSAVQWDSGAINPSSGTYSFKFVSPGTYTYHCNFHSYMHGTIIVTA